MFFSRAVISVVATVIGVSVSFALGSIARHSFDSAVWSILIADGLLAPNSESQRSQTLSIGALDGWLESVGLMSAINIIFFQLFSKRRSLGIRWKWYCFCFLSSLVLGIGTPILYGRMVELEVFLEYQDSSYTEIQVLGAVTSEEIEILLEFTTDTQFYALGPSLTETPRPEALFTQHPNHLDQNVYLSAVGNWVLNLSSGVGGYGSFKGVSIEWRSSSVTRHPPTRF